MVRRVDVDEFSGALAGAVPASEPLAVTRHGVVVGWFVPARDQRDRQVGAVRAAAAVLDGQLATAGVDADELVAEYATLRAGRDDTGSR